MSRVDEQQAASTIAMTANYVISSGTQAVLSWHDLAWHFTEVVFVSVNDFKAMNL